MVLEITSICMTQLEQRFGIPGPSGQQRTNLTLPVPQGLEHEILYVRAIHFMYHVF